MQFRYKLQYQLVKLLNVSNRNAKQLIEAGTIKINEQVVYENCLVEDTDAIYFYDKCVRPGKIYKYWAFHKPRGVETRLDELKKIIEVPVDFFHVGRLDKDSEGLLILSNDGQLANQLLNKDNYIEKIYDVEVDSPISIDFKEFMQNGVTIMGKTTRPCEVTITGDRNFQIKLVEGMNRQIRRMCYKVGYKVERLIRKSFAGIELDIAEGAWRSLAQKEIMQIRSLVADRK